MFVRCRLPKLNYVVQSEEDIGDAEIEVGPVSLRAALWLGIGGWSTRWHSACSFLLYIGSDKALLLCCYLVVVPQIDEDPTAGVSLDVTGVPICVTFFLIGQHFVVDVDLDEECCCSTRVLVSGVLAPTLWPWLPLGRPAAGEGSCPESLPFHSDDCVAHMRPRYCSMHILPALSHRVGGVVMCELLPLEL